MDKKIWSRSNDSWTMCENWNAHYEEGYTVSNDQTDPYDH